MLSLFVLFGDILDVSRRLFLDSGGLLGEKREAVFSRSLNHPHDQRQRKYQSENEIDHAHCAEQKFYNLLRVTVRIPRLPTKTITHRKTTKTGWQNRRESCRQHLVTTNSYDAECHRRHEECRSCQQYQYFCEVRFHVRSAGGKQNLSSRVADVLRRLQQDGMMKN